MFLPLMHVCHNNRIDFAGGRGVWGHWNKRDQAVVWRDGEENEY